MVSDRGTVATLTATNDKLTKQLEEAQSSIKKLKQDIVNIHAKMNPAWQGK
jgi:prefoldin subunit 5